MSAQAPLPAYSARVAPTARTDLAFYPCLLAAGVALWWLSVLHPSTLPPFGPWDFSWPEFLAAALALWWYGRGVAATPTDERPSAVRQGLFAAGVLAIYAVLQTHFDYLAQHMFFVNRAQHIVMHHLGPMLIALGWPGAALHRGMPAPLRRIIDQPAAAALVDAIQQPFLASVLFVGLIALWLTPAVHFRAMLDPDLYAAMNWSMVIDGILFWVLMLDPRSKPPARLSFGGRAACTLAVMFPQIAIGATIAFSARDLYPFYAFCGRVWPGVTPLYDQAVGGLIVWIPGAMMSVAGVLLVLNNLRRQEDQALDEGSALAISSSSWTGR